MNAEEQCEIWDFYKPRHTHAWNMLVLSWRAFERISIEEQALGELDFCWENFFIRLWLYRTTVKTLTKIPFIANETQNALKSFDVVFSSGGFNQLKAIRDMIEHFDDYAAGKGRGPAKRDSELDPWRSYDLDKYERGRFSFDRLQAYNAAIDLRAEAKVLSSKFIDWYKIETARPVDGEL